MASVLALVPACDNCVSVDSSPYYRALLVLAVVGAILGGLILVRTRGALGKPRLYGAVAAVCLGIGLPVAVALTHVPISVNGAACGGALHASRERGFPTDAALDPGQTACKQEGQSVVDFAMATGVAALVGGGVMTIAAGRARA